MSYKNFTLDVDADGIALITWDMPEKSMNVFNESVIDELGEIVGKVASDAAVKGAVITSGKETFSGGADLTMMRRMLDLFEAEKAKDGQKAVQFLFDNVGRMTGAVPQAGDRRASRGFRPSTAPAWAAPSKCRWPAMAASPPNDEKVKMGAAGSEGRHLPWRRRHPARAAARRQPQESAADADLRPEPDAAEGQGDGADPRDRRAGEAGRDRQGDDQERPQAGAAMGREGLQAARRPDLFGGGRQSVAAGNRHPAPRDLRQLPGRQRDPEMRL